MVLVRRALEQLAKMQASQSGILKIKRLVVGTNDGKIFSRLSMRLMLHGSVLFRITIRAAEYITAYYKIL